MRHIVIKQDSDGEALATRLLARRSNSSATLDRLKALNPHVDFNRIKAGTVLLLPDTLDVKAGAEDARSIGSDALGDLIKRTEEGFKTAAERVHRAAETLAADRAAVTSALGAAVVKRHVESDPLLKKQLEDADQASEAEQKAIREAAEHVVAMQEAVSVELAELAKLLR